MQNALYIRCRKLCNGMTDTEVNFHFYFILILSSLLGIIIAIDSGINLSTLSYMAYVMASSPVNPSKNLAVESHIGS